MPATVTQVHVTPGQQVQAGDVLLTLEAMKMELPIRASAAGVVKSINCRTGELVRPGNPLVELTETPNAERGTPNAERRTSNAEPRRPNRT
jgi:biotin carboxyl carrier protein